MHREPICNVVLVSWGPTPGQVVLALRGYLSTPMTVVQKWRVMDRPVVATGDRRDLSSFLVALEAAGAKYELEFVDDYD